MPLQSGFITIGTSGKTVDGRKIEASWLEEAAQAYDPDLYTAVIDLNHWDTRWAGTYGKVLAVDTQKDKHGETVLRANIEPSQNLVYMSKSQVLFTSMGLAPNFRDSGKHYLETLAVTPKPASVGTQQLIFSSPDCGDDKKITSDFMRAEFNFDDAPASENITPEEKVFTRLFKKLFSHEDGDEHTQESTPMADEDKITGERLNTLETKLDKLFERIPAPVTQEALTAAQTLLDANGFSVTKSDGKEEDSDLTAAETILKNKGYSITKPKADDENATVSRAEFTQLQKALSEATGKVFGATDNPDQPGGGDNTDYL